jgi:hypothetical protein
MKPTLFSIAILALTFFSCSKKDINCTGQASMSIEGKWRMITVKDNSSGWISSKPSSIPGDVDIIFTPRAAVNGIFSGKTPSNDIWENDYSTGNNNTLSIPVLSMTKVAETSWGREFVDHIIDSREFSFNNGDLLIKTISRTLTFRKL